MLKGKMTIELTDVNTGEVNVIKEENMVTNALANIFKDEMIRLKELEDARREVEKTTEKPKPANQNMFRAV